MHRFEKTAFITAAIQGVGKGMFRVFTYEGMRVALVDWREDLLAAVAWPGMYSSVLLPDLESY